VDIIAESAQPLTNTIALKDYLCRRRRATDEYLRNLGWTLPPSPLSVLIGKGDSAILSTGDYRHRSRIRNTHL